MSAAPRIDAVVVVVPARDEQDLVGSCLGSVRRALDAIAADVPRQTVVLVADGCTDLTVTMARLAWGEDPRLEVVAAPATGPGAARRLGVAVGQASVGVAVDSTWVATTDADSRVPRDWLVRQLAWAARGYVGVAGTVWVDDWTDEDVALRRRYERMLDDARLPDGRHSDVFGANLGVHARALRDVGGFPALAVGEDHAVWDRLVELGVPTVQAVDVTVATSGRREGRASGGLADLLERMAVAGGGH
jgi:glycosyltransferase involved in cell wall biosynthesis